eukprot:TRINITY_DN79978_c0_g1_i1.p1 TRINITY_DN79978_c0_g1~~TRINITY_DN79978_c0_g1_i1.p1  ORF type:complete len:733 (-),score=174.96 TRINITY_DN79978_c0_g1_i1:103-2301(-)
MERRTPPRWLWLWVVVVLTSAAEAAMLRATASTRRSVAVEENAAEVSQSQEAGENSDQGMDQNLDESMSQDVDQGMLQAAGDEQAAGSDDATAGASGEGDIAVGSRVVIIGLQSAVELNGVQAKVRKFDQATGRYVVQLPGDGKLKKILPKNLLRSKPTAEERHERAMQGFMQETQARIAALTKKDDGDEILQRGAKVRIEGLLKAPQLNGLVGTIRTYDYGTERYVVELPKQQPRRLRLDNLVPLGAGGRPLHEAAADEQQQQQQPGEARGGGQRASICAAVTAQDGSNPPADTGPLHLAPGSNITLRNLTSAAALKAHLNGMEGVVHCFDAASGRYVIALADGKPRKIKAQNIGLVQPAPICQAELSSGNGAVDNGPRGFAPGTNVTLQNLTSAAAVKAHLNGMAAVVHCFDKMSGRYVVALENGGPRKIRPENLALQKNSTHQAAVSGLLGVASVRKVESSPDTRMAVCNAYASRAPMQVFALKDGPQKKKRYTQVARNVAYQECADIRDFPYAEGSLSFVIGRYTVGRYQSLNASRLGSSHGLELTVYRPSVNSLKATVHENVVQLSDLKAYHLNVVDAYAGAKHLELHVKRGTFVQKLSLNSTFRLSREQQLTFTLSDGTQHLHLSFQPRRSRTYTVMVTGTDMGLRGEPRNVGLVAHELGAWTSSEELPPAAPSNHQGLLLEAEARHKAERARDGENDNDRSPAASFRSLGSLGIAMVLFVLTAML